MSSGRSAPSPAVGQTHPSKSGTAPELSVLSKILNIYVPPNLFSNADLVAPL